MLDPIVSLADLTSRPICLKVEVKDDSGNPTGEVLEYMMHPLTFRDIGELQRWVDEQFPDPYETAWSAIERRRASGSPFNVAQEQFLLKNAAELAARARHLIGTPEADQLLGSTEGFKRIVIASIRKGYSGFDDAAADRLISSMSKVDIMRAYAGSQMNMMLSDPKPEAPDAKPISTPNGTSTSRRTRRAQAANARTGGKSSTR